MIVDSIARYMPGTSPLLNRYDLPGRVRDFAKRIVAAHSRVAAALLFGVAILTAARGARAQFFSAADGYTPDGKWQVQTELMPYGWLPATSASLSFDNRRDTTLNANTGLPSAQELSNVLRGAFMGAALVRYGPFSAELDTVYVSVDQSKELPPNPPLLRRANLDASLVRVAPGVGIEAFNGSVVGVPTIIDARWGFAWFDTEQRLKGEESLQGLERSHTDSLVQPWIGARATFILDPRWRIMLDGMGQGFGLNGGVTGWGVSAIASYAVTDWVNVTLGFRALNSSHAEGTTDLPGATRRSFSLTEYGPVLGFGFRF